MVGSGSGEWNRKEPIYWQLRNQLVSLILDGILNEGDALPSVRRIAVERRVNPITVSKALQLLADEGLVEKRRGIGTYVRMGARERLLRLERELFLREEWPLVVERAARLGLMLPRLRDETVEPEQRAGKR